MYELLYKILYHLKQKIAYWEDLTVRILRHQSQIIESEKYVRKNIPGCKIYLQWRKTSIGQVYIIKVIRPDGFMFFQQTEHSKYCTKLKTKLENWAHLQRMIHNHILYYSKGVKSPDERFVEKWMDNIEKGVGDANGETIPAEGSY